MSPDTIDILGPPLRRGAEILTDEALSFLAMLHREFDIRRLELLDQRAERWHALRAGDRPKFLARTASVRAGGWRVPPAPSDLADRRVEITGPVERKMMINAFNSGARCFMADFEDANSPTWENCVEGQANLIDAIERTIEVETPTKTYRLDDEIATLIVRPRGWHLLEKHVEIGGRPMSAALFDFGLFAFHCTGRLLERGTAPYLYLPKLESHEEASLWNDVFVATQDTLGVPIGTIRATVLIETILAAFEMDEILFSLGPHATALNAGRWDYIFSMIKKLGEDPVLVLPDREQVTMAVPFMRAYAKLLVRTCHRRGAHAMGGMAAFIPSRRDPAINEMAFNKVRADKEREASDGFDGTWVAHPDLVPVATEVFDRVIGSGPNQLDHPQDDVRVTARDLLDVRIDGGRVTRAGVRSNVGVALSYVESWLRGVGAVGINNLMEDAATAEIARSQIWQWVRHGSILEDGEQVTSELVARIVQEEIERIRSDAVESDWMANRFEEAKAVFELTALSSEFVEFLTIPAYRQLP